MTSQISRLRPAHHLDHGMGQDTRVPEHLQRVLVAAGRKQASSRANRLLIWISKIKPRCKSSIPRGSAFLNLFVKGCLSRFGRDCTNRRVYPSWSVTSLSAGVDRLTFSLPMVWMTSSGGVPRSSVILYVQHCLSILHDDTPHLMKGENDDGKTHMEN